MANYQALMRVRPEYREFIRHRRLVYRGEVVVFGPNIRCDAFSTDGAGFRHSTFDGKTLTVGDVLNQERYGLVLGSSHLFGLGVAGNEKTIPSLLAARFGFPFANVSLPEGNSRNLSSFLVAFIARAPRPPSVVIHLSGGDITNFTLSSIADPVFGSPNIKQIDLVAKERRMTFDPERQFPALLAFTSLWTRSIVMLCSARGIPVVLGNDTTFFEKQGKPNAVEQECELGKAFNSVQKRWYENQKRFMPEFLQRREAIAEAMNVPLAGPGASNTWSFVDEFHYDADSTRAFADTLAKAIETVLKR